MITLASFYIPFTLTESFFYFISVGFFQENVFFYVETTVNIDILLLYMLSGARSCEILSTCHIKY